MSDTSYADSYRGVDFRREPERYQIGRGEQGVLMAEPYKSELLPHWRFATEAAAEASAGKIFAMFEEYKGRSEFVGMDMARKFLQMGFTRARRYANHSSGRKYEAGGGVRPQDSGSEDSEKARAARVFYGYYVRAKDDADYQRLAKEHRQRQAG